MTGVAVPFPVVTVYTFTAATGLTLTGSNVAWTPNTIATKAIPLGTDFAAGYDATGAVAAKFLLSAFPISTAQQTAITAAQVAGQQVYRSVNALAGNRALALTDAGAILPNAGVNSQITLPLNATVAFTTGTKIDLVRGGAGTLSFVAAGGVTIIVTTGNTQVAATGAGASLTYLGADTWWLVGQLAP